MHVTVNHVLLFFNLLFIFIIKGLCTDRWSRWWTYDGFSGPTRWGWNKDWSLCKKGKNQSPVNVVPQDLLFDPGLKHVKIVGNKISATMKNHGNGVGLYLRDNVSDSIYFSVGPLSYTYKMHMIRMHFGKTDTTGSEHTIDKKQFAAELHLFAYNIDLYKNFSQAVKSPRGIAAIALFVQVQGNYSDPELEKIVERMGDIHYKDQQTLVEGVYIKGLIPNSPHYVTYEGSLTYPGCYETVTWIIMNKPIKSGKHQLEAIRSLRRSGSENPQAYMFNTVRPVQSLERRSIRTNINFEQGCSMERNVHYQVTFPESFGMMKALGKDSSDQWSDVTTIK